MAAPKTGRLRKALSVPHDLREAFVRRTRDFRGRAVNFFVDKVRLPDGRPAVREYLDHPGAAAVLPLLDRRTLILVEQYRYPVGRRTLEIPAGKLDPGESVLACLRRELREETGFTARRVTPLIRYWPTPAFSNELLHVYLAQGLALGRRDPDPDEFLRVVRLPLEEALRRVLEGRIRDSKTVVALLAYRSLPKRKDYTK